MQIYDIKSDIKNKVVMDVTSINNKNIISFDHYLYQFPLEKQLVYAYLKNNSVESEKLSVLHNMFSKFNTLEWFNSDEHQHLILTNAAYAKIVQRYVRNVFTWVTSIQHLQSYFFDSKYLLIGEYQHVAKKCADKYFNAQFNHALIPYSTIKFVDAVPQHNKWFIEKNNIEHRFFTKILQNITFPKQLRVKYYNKYIECYDDISTLTLQFQLEPYEIRMKIIWPDKSNKRSRKTTQIDIMKFLQRHISMFHLYQVLSKSLESIQNYFEELEQNKQEHRQSYDILLGVMTSFITDFHEKSKSSYLDINHIFGYVVHENSVERVLMHSHKNRLRIYRRVKYLNDTLNRSDELRYSSYRLDEVNIEDQAIELLDSGYLAFSRLDDEQTLFDFELLATGKNVEFAMQYFKMTYVNAMSLFSEYEDQLLLLDAEVEHHINNNTIVSDTRKNVAIKQDYISTSFELYAKEHNEKLFNEDRESRLNAKRKKISQFIKKYKKQINYFTNENS